MNKKGVVLATAAFATPALIIVALGIFALFGGTTWAIIENSTAILWGVGIVLGLYILSMFRR